MPFIYKISSPHTDKVYIGSTTRDLRVRFLQHKRNDNPTHSKQIIAFGDAIIECLEEVDDDTMKERERFYIELMREKCVNYQIPSRTPTEWRQDNKEIILKKVKEWNENHREHRKEYMKNYIPKKKYNQNPETKLNRQTKYELCECGINVRYDNKHNHLKTKKHLGKIKIELII